MNKIFGLNELIEPAVFKTRFCYRIDKRAKLAQDENGNPSECYVQFAFNHKKKMPLEKFNEMHNGSSRELVAETIKQPIEYITPVTAEEHDRETEED